MLIATDNEGRTVFQVASDSCEPEIFQGILDLAIENLTAEEVNKLLIATDNSGRTVFHVAAEFCKPEIFQ